MKKTASRILALIVALSMLLVPSAFAAGRNAASLTIGNFELTMGEQAISLPVYLNISGGAEIENERGYLTANLSTEEQVAFAVAAALENGDISAYLNGMNYGLTIPVEQILSMLEEEMGMSFEEAAAELIAEGDMQATLNSTLELLTLMEALENVEVDSEAMMEALGLTLTDKGETTVILFDVEAAATEIELALSPITLKAVFDAMGAVAPEMNAFYTEYFKLLNETLASSGEEMTIEQALEMITIAMNGSVYEAEEGLSAELYLTATVTDGDESVSFEIPLYFVTLTDAEGTYTEVMLDMPVDGEGLYLDVYTDSFTDETGTYQNIIYSASVYDVEDNGAEMDLSVALYTSDTADGFTVGADLSVAENGDEPAVFGVYHTCYETALTEESDVYNGYLYAYATIDEVPYQFYMDTSLTLSAVPAEALLVLSESINPLEADEDTMNQFITDATTALTSGLGVLMQDPTLAGMLSSGILD